MPLGNFIKPSQEKTACGGGRAFHMCSMGMTKIHTEDRNTSPKIAFADAAGVEKAPKVSSSGSGEDLFLLDLTKKQLLLKSRYDLSDIFPRYCDFFPSIEAVPKI